MGGFLTVEKYTLYSWIFDQQLKNTVGRHFFDIYIHATFSGCTATDIPQGDVVFEKQIFPVLVIDGERFVKQMEKDFPKPVLGMRIVLVRSNGKIARK